MALGNKSGGISGAVSTDGPADNNFHWINGAWVAVDGLWEKLKTSSIAKDGSFVKWYDPIWNVAFFANRAASDGTPGSETGIVPQFTVPVGTSVFYARLFGGGGRNVSTTCGGIPGGHGGCTDIRVDTTLSNSFINDGDTLHMCVGVRGNVNTSASHHGSGGYKINGRRGAGGGTWIVKKAGNLAAGWNGVCSRPSPHQANFVPVYGSGGGPGSNWTQSQKDVYNNFVACAGGGGAASNDAGVNTHGAPCSCDGPAGGDGGGGGNYYGCGTAYAHRTGDCATKQGCGNFQATGASRSNSGKGIGSNVVGGHFFVGARAPGRSETGGGGWGGGGAGEYGSGGGSGNIRRGGTWSTGGNTGIYDASGKGRARGPGGPPGWNQHSGTWNSLIPQWVQNAHGSGTYNFGANDKHGLIIVQSYPFTN